MPARLSTPAAASRRTPPGSLGWTAVKALLLENIHPLAVEILEGRGFEVELLTHSMTEDELVEALPGVSLLGIRSNTTRHRRGCSTPRTDLLAVGCFCIGTNQVDLVGAAERGVAVFNAPYSNTRSVVELVIGEIIALARRLAEKTERMHDGVWDKSAKGSHEIRGRTLGIVGYGNIGTQLSNVAEAIGLRVHLLRHRRPARPRQRAPDEDPRRAARRGRRRHAARRRAPRQRRALRRGAVREDEAAVAVHQRRPRHGRRHRRRCASTSCPATSPAPPWTSSRSSPRRRATRSSRRCAASTTSS